MANGLPNGTTTVNLNLPAQLYGDRITQVDMRFAKVLRFGSRRVDVGFDLLNVFNTSDATVFTETYDFATNDLSAPDHSRVAEVRAVQCEARLLNWVIG